MTAQRGQHKTAILVICCAAQFMTVLGVSIVNVALPSMGHDLGIAPIDLHWIINGYTVAFGGFLLLGGRAGDVFGRREVFVGGLLLVIVSSLIGGLAQSAEVLTAARAMQGLGAAAVAPASLAILIAFFSEGPERNRAIGLWSGLGGVGGAIGAFVGGVLTDLLGWHWVLLINVPVCVCLVVASFIYVPRRQRGPREQSLDVPGAFLITAAMLTLIFGIVQTKSHDWLSIQVLGLFGLSAVVFAIFIAVEKSVSRDPMVPLELFKRRTLSGAAVTIVLSGAASFAVWLIAALYLQDVLGYTPLQAGLGMLPAGLALAVGARVGGWACGRFGAGNVLMFGMLLQAGTLLWLSQISAGGTYWSDLFVPVVFCSVGVGMSVVSGNLAATAGVERRVSGLISAVVNTARTVGGAIGVALLSSIAAAHTNDRTDVAAISDGFGYALYFAAGIALAGAFVAWFFVSREQEPATTTPAIGDASG